MSHVTSFVFKKHRVTVLLDNSNNPWFKGKDVARILGYNNLHKTLWMHVSERYKRPQKEIGLPQNGVNLSYNESKVVFISEPGLYELIFSSKMPVAKDFKFWVFEKVLPSIRKCGGYRLKHQNHLLLQSLAQSLKTNRQLSQINKEFKSVNDMLCKENQSMNQTLTEQTPKVAVMSTSNEFNHVFCILEKDSLQENDGVREYKCIRTQKRSYRHSLKKAKKHGFVPCFSRFPVSNGVNILNKAKEVMLNHGMHYDSAHNNILTKHNFVKVVEQLLNE